MNRLKITFLLCFSLVSFICPAQNCKSNKKMERKAKKHLVEDEIIKATKLRQLFSKFSQAASTNLVKTDKGYYLRLQLVRELGRRIDIMKDNPLVLQFKNGEIITLYPDRDLPGKFTLPATTEFNRPFYIVSTEQLEQFAKHPISQVKIYFTSEKVPEDKRGVDDLGTFFDYEILSERYQNNLVEAANCMLQSN
ncbi:hypothetical protein GWK08_00660 [Leptobacterium flavescens]|uniref:DUF4384 domain-containing protein n=1 Tax=Leptobacterium flavescens TaxID=472055 RepID=A0A6P0UFZ2_9FLAO|nr:hypothetical protein [Leptobacterium flavescens]NER11937.1 hypothetical protein [Leptobacterium flavescens]